MCCETLQFVLPHVEIINDAVENTPPIGLSVHTNRETKEEGKQF